MTNKQDAPDTRTLKILQRYAAGKILARQAAKEMGPKASEHSSLRRRLPDAEPKF
jgi:hypothetical protein